MPSSTRLHLADMPSIDDAANQTISSPKPKPCLHVSDSDSDSDSYSDSEE